MASGQDHRHGSSAKRGYGGKWQRAREEFLARHPLCQCPACDEGRVCVRASSVVDHKTPPRLGEAIASKDADAIKRAQRLFWDEANWQALAKECHDSWKQRLEKSGRVAGATEDGIPIDPNHHWRRGRPG